MKYSSSHRTRFYLEFAAVLVVVIIPIFVHAGVIPSVNDMLHQEAKAQTAAVANATPVAVLQNDIVTDTGGGDIFVSNGALVATGPAGEDEVATSRLTNGEISVYTVRTGDSLSQIAEMYGVTTNTILWANDLSDPTEIQPGDTLVILPIVGVQHVIKDGDTLQSISKKYDGNEEEILAYNQLASSDALKVGEQIVIPGGRIQQAPAPSSRVAAAPQPVSQSGTVSSGNGFSHPAPGTVRTQANHGYNAVDLAAPVGTPILAAAAGEVIVSKPSGWNGGYGRYIVIRHPNGTQTLYAHNSQNYVGVGEYVSAGQTIAAIGSSGRSTGPHVHFEVRGARNPF